jgi:hypothetical protein
MFHFWVAQMEHHSRQTCGFLAGWKIKNDGEVRGIDSNLARGVVASDGNRGTSGRSTICMNFKDMFTFNAKRFEKLICWTAFDLYRRESGPQNPIQQMQVTMPLNNTLSEHRLKRIHNHRLPVRGRNNSCQDEDIL